MTMNTPSRKLTNSRIYTLLTCPYMHYLRYEIGLRTERDGLALRFGSAWHKAMELVQNGMSIEETFNACIDKFDRVDEEMEVAKLSGLLTGYYAVYEGKQFTGDTEIPFSYALRTGRAAMSVCGVIDGLTDEPCALLERKTTGSDISPTSDYWLRLRGDRQVQMYVIAARKLGFDPRMVIWDVVRKPAIRQKQTETVEMYAERLAADCQERPDFYFQRREMPVIESDLRRTEKELRMFEMEILWKRRKGIWPRNISERICPGCEFNGPCMSGMEITPDTPAPQGFFVGDPHPELAERGSK